MLALHFEEGRAWAMTDTPMLTVLWMRMMVMMDKPHHFR